MSFSLVPEDIHWWEDSSSVLPVRIDGGVHWYLDWFRRVKALTGITLYNKEVQGSCSLVGVRLLRRRLSKYVLVESHFGVDNTFHNYRTNDTVVTIDVGQLANGRCSLYIQVITTSKKIVSNWTRWLGKWVSKEHDSNGNVFMLVATDTGVNLQVLGYAAVPIDFCGYSKSIHESITRMALDLRSPHPSGRISILEGCPGTGKTFLLRGMLAEVPHATFIFVPPVMVEKLSDPGLVSSILSLKKATILGNDVAPTRAGPVILLCEDADSILTKRGSDNRDSVASMLNLSAGLIGEIIDIRIIATTNADKSSIDEAILRPGRLSTYIKIPPLSNEEACTLYTRLTKLTATISTWEATRSTSRKVGFSNEDIPTGDLVRLSEVYAAARATGWLPPPIATSKLRTPFDL